MLFNHSIDQYSTLLGF